MLIDVITSFTSIDIYKVAKMIMLHSYLQCSWIKSQYGFCIAIYNVDNL